MQDELEQRVAVLRRFRELLVRQCECFRQYLAALETQQAVIESSGAEELLFYVEREEQIVAEIFSIQKVIAPLENMYQTDGNALGGGAIEGDDIPVLKMTLENLKNQAAVISAHNRDMIAVRMAELRSEIAGLKKHPLAAAARSFYQNSVAASMVDIEG